jgi:phage-related protein
MLKIYGQGDLGITVNDKAFLLKAVTDYVTVDSEIMNCYKEDLGVLTSKNNSMIGEFPIFVPGENSISWTGNITKIEITPRWRWL